MLKDGDFVLTQNAAILQYLAELHPSARLLGGDTPRERAEVVRWVAFLNSDVHKAFAPLFGPRREPGADRCADDLAAVARQKIRRYLGLLDGQLEGRDWIAGHRSVADPYLFVIYRWATALRIEADDLLRLAAFAERMYADAGVRTALSAEEGPSSGRRAA